MYRRCVCVGLHMKEEFNTFTPKAHLNQLQESREQNEKIPASKMTIEGKKTFEGFREVLLL